MSKRKLEKLCKKWAEEGMSCEMIGNALLVNDDCMRVLRRLPSNSIDSCVIDPPFGINHLGHTWDNFNPKAIARGIRRKGGAGISPSMFAGKYDKTRIGSVRYQQWCNEWAKEVFRVLLPGGHLISFCSPKKYHRMVTAIEDSHFEIRDMITWLAASGHPFSHDISKAIDKMYGAEREIVGPNPNRKGRENWDDKQKNLSLPSTDDAKKWDGWGTRLRQTSEPIVLARKPLSEKTVARNVLRNGTGGLNIAATRIPSEEKLTNRHYEGFHCHRYPGKEETRKIIYTDCDSRFPSNTIISEEAADLLDDKAKFYYCAKVTKKERNAGCEHLAKTGDNEGNTHPTVKPIDLMEYLVKLVTPKRGVCLDIFMGAGTTGIACASQGFDFIGVEREEEYYEIAKARISHWQNVKKAA